jgi:hypothetical protein
MTPDDEDALVERLVRAGRADGPSVRALQTAALTVSALLGSAGAQAAAAGAAPAALSPLLLLKSVGVGALAGASLMAVVHAPDWFRPAEATDVMQTGPARAPAPTIGVTPPDLPAPPTVVAAPSASVSGASVATRPDVAREVRLLDSARRELVEGDAAAALRSLSLLERLPGRVLVPEATLLRVRALLAQGNHDEARRVADAFCVAAPSSPQTKVLRALVANTQIQPPPR